MTDDRLGEDAATDAPHHDPDSGVIGTLQSLIVAFVLAMTFRGFVAEGFVIPTGSMAPTLLGQHHLIHSELTGYSFPVSVGERRSLVDPMLGPDHAVRGGLQPESPRSRMGDRILVLKGLYSLTEPKRWDVIVFKNPTEPKGEAGNYIKRLVGLPNETVWLADGDVYVQENGGPFRIERKPEHIQRALWQPVHHSDYVLVQPGQLSRAYHGPPWTGDQWDVSGREYRTDTDAPTNLSWEGKVREIDDWTAYNMLLSSEMVPSTAPVSDIRVAAGVVPDQSGISMTLELVARGHEYEFIIADGRATVRYRPERDREWTDSAFAPIDLPLPGRVFNVEFWHVDQAMSIYIDRRRVVHLEYDWSPMERVEWATGLTGDRAVNASRNDSVQKPSVQWRFEGSPVTLHRVRLDRDLHYRSATVGPRHQRNEPLVNGPGFGTHPVRLAVLGPDHYMMLGDNSQASLDSRLWGSPHPLVARIDPSPFVVHRKLLLGKAWVVYFPAPYAITDGGINIIPDFGQLRYIR